MPELPNSAEQGQHHQELSVLESQEAEQALLEEQVTQLELERETTRSGMARFQKRYYDIVGRLYVELDALQAEQALRELEASPQDLEARQRAEAAQAQARRSAEEAGMMEVQDEIPPEISPECRQAYRKAAKLMHPDRATTDDERERRTQLMSQVNLAYERGDVKALEKLIEEFGEDPESVVGVDLPARLEKSRRRIAQLRRRLAEIEQEMEAISCSEIYLMKCKVEEAEAMGDDPLGEMAKRIQFDIASLRKQQLMKPVSQRNP